MPTADRENDVIVANAGRRAECAARCDRRPATACHPAPEHFGTRRTEPGASAEILGTRVCGARQTTPASRRSPAHTDGQNTHTRPFLTES